MINPHLERWRGLIHDPEATGADYLRACLDAQDEGCLGAVLAYYDEQPRLSAWVDGWRVIVEDLRQQDPLKGDGWAPWVRAVEVLEAFKLVERSSSDQDAKAELKERLKRGGTDLQQVLKDAETDEILGKMKVSALLEALPKVGKVKAQEIMTELEIAPTRRLRGLGDRQRKALLERFSS